MVNSEIIRKTENDEAMSQSDGSEVEMVTHTGGAKSCRQGKAGS